MAYGLSNGHVTDDVTWPWKVKLLTSIRLERNISKTAGDIGTPLQRTTNKKWYMVYQTTLTFGSQWTDYVTDNVWISCCICRRRLSVVCTECIVAKRCILEQKLLLTVYRKSYMRNRLAPKWTRGRIKVMSTIALHLTLNISDTVKDRGWFQRTTTDDRLGSSTA